MASQGIRLLVAFCEHSDGFKEYLRLNPAKDDFKGEHENAVFAYVEKFASKFGSLPKWKTVLEEGSKAGWDFALPDGSEATEPPAFYHDKVTERRVHDGLKAALLEGSAMLNGGTSPSDTLAALGARMHALQMRDSANRIMDFAADAHGMIKKQLAALAHGNIQGLQFGWAYLDGMTGGLVAGDVASIIGRPAQGKTFALLYAAHNHWKNQKGVPLVISMEMNKAIITQRLAAMDAKISLTHIKTGNLDTKKQMQPLLSKLLKNQQMQPFYIVDGALSVTVTQVKMLCQQLKPSSVWIDGAYLMRHENAKLNRWEKATDNAERIKSDIAEGLGLPAIVSYQFNRMATQKKHGPPGVEDIAYTDAIGQLSSLVLGMSQEESVETMKKRTIQVLKGRSGEVGEFAIHWSFAHPDAMNFSQYVEPTISELSYM